MSRAERSVRRMAVKGYSWRMHEIETALTHPEVWLRDVEIEEVGVYPKIERIIMRRDGYAVELPACWDDWRQMTNPLSFVIPDDISRALGAEGVTFMRRQRTDQWSVTIPFAWFDF